MAGEILFYGSHSSIKHAFPVNLANLGGTRRMRKISRGSVFEYDLVLESLLRFVRNNLRDYNFHNNPYRYE